MFAINQFQKNTDFTFMETNPENFCLKNFPLFVNESCINKLPYLKAYNVHFFFY